MTGKRPVNPEDLAPPIGFAHAWLVEAPSVRTLYLAGQCGHNAEGVLEGVGDLVAQMDKAMGNIARVLEEAQMTFQDVMQLNFYVCSRNDYVVARKAFGKALETHYNLANGNGEDTDDEKDFSDDDGHVGFIDEFPAGR